MEKNNKYLVLNVGSSSLKFTLFKMPEETELISGVFDSIGEEHSSYSITINEIRTNNKIALPNYKTAIEIMLKELMDNNIINCVEEIKAVGHRIVHGGEFYSESTIIDEEVLKNIENLTELAPAHHPSEIEGIKLMQTCMPNTPQVAVFDTAFHQSIKPEKYLYSVPYEWYTNLGVRKYGFHGTSYRYITQFMQNKLNKKDINLIVLHLGNGTSAACIKDGLSIDTTMGLTPLDGLMMLQRCGNIDPSIIEYVMKNTAMTSTEIFKILNKDSGLRGITHIPDIREVVKSSNEGNEQATLGLNMLASSFSKIIAQYYMELEGKVDAIVFTAGVGENQMGIRAVVVEKISPIMNVHLDSEINNQTSRAGQFQESIITTIDSAIPIMVIPTKEELMIARDTYNKTIKVEKTLNTKPMMLDKQLSYHE